MANNLWGRKNIRNHRNNNRRKNSESGSNIITLIINLLHNN